MTKFRRVLTEPYPISLEAFEHSLKLFSKYLLIPMSQFYVRLLRYHEPVIRVSNCGVLTAERRCNGKASHY